MNEKLKKLIFYKLYENLKHVEVIPHKNSIWFIDTKQKYWYFELEKNSGLLWWRWCYFENYFDYFSLEPSDAEYVMSRWVEEVLNSKVTTTKTMNSMYASLVEEVLNSKVTTTTSLSGRSSAEVEKVLNSKVTTPHHLRRGRPEEVEEVLNSKVVRTAGKEIYISQPMENAINSTVRSCTYNDAKQYAILDEVLNTPIKKSSNSIKNFIKNLFNIKKFLTFTQTIK